MVKIELRKNVNFDIREIGRLLKILSFKMKKRKFSNLVATEHQQIKHLKGNKNTISADFIQQWTS